MMESEKYTLTEDKSQFPILSEATHFHYEEVKLHSLFLTAKLANSQQQPGLLFEIGVFSGHAAWNVKKSLSDVYTLDHQLHLCLLGRSFSNLPALSNALRNVPSSHSNEFQSVVESYFKSLAQLINSHNTSINCSRVLSWFELDNKGNHLSVIELHHVNIPAIAAAQVIRRHFAESDNELNLIEGDLISLIDMPSPNENSWWRGKKGFKVGYFPSQCVILIDTRRAAESAASALSSATDCNGAENRSSSTSPSSSASSSSSGISSNKPVLKNHGKIASCLHVLFRERPSRDTLRQSGIYIFDRVFGCDLGQYLANHNQQDGVPLVVRWCVEMIERCGIVDGIYRHSGSNQNIHALRAIFDAGRLPSDNDAHTRDAHAVSCLLKTYFRELPNPLLTHNLYFDFIDAADIQDEQESLAKLRHLLNRLPPPHHRTLKYVICHLWRISSRSGSTGMTPKNLSIVWAPNLLRPFLMAPKDCLLYVTRQSRVIELMIANYTQLFETAQKQILSDQPVVLSSAAAQPFLLSIDVAQKLYQQNSALMPQYAPKNRTEDHFIAVSGIGSSQSHDNLTANEEAPVSTTSKCKASLKKIANIVRENLPQSNSSKSIKAKPTIVHCNPKMNQSSIDPGNQAVPVQPQMLGRKPSAWRTISRSRSISSPDDPRACTYIDDVSEGKGEAASPICHRWPLASDNSMVWTGDTALDNPAVVTLVSSSSYTALNSLLLNNSNSTNTTPVQLGGRSASKVVLVRGPAMAAVTEGSPRIVTRHRSADELSMTGLVSGSTSVTTLSPLVSKKDGLPVELNADHVDAMMLLLSTKSVPEKAMKTSIEHATPILPIDLESPVQQALKPSTCSRQLLVVPLKQQQNVVALTPKEETPNVKEMRYLFEGNSGVF